MKLAKIEEIQEIINIFRQYPKIFPHIRKDKILDYITKNKVIFDEGIVIVFNKYSKRIKLGNVNISKGSWILHQIVNKEPGNGKSQLVLNNFLSNIDDVCYLTVRRDNERAIKFYNKNGFLIVGNIDWKQGEIKGVILRKEKINE